ncbi:MAG: FAD-binding oxidoreductase [Alphaproteobacteria bacterium]
MNKQISTTDMKLLEQVLGIDNVSSDLEKRELFSQDIWAKGQTADFVISPENTDQLADAIKIATRAKIRLNPRGGGMSYTKGFTPTSDKTGIIDFTRMDKVLEINKDDMYVTVQAGCTWKTLYEALKPLGLRTPFWGPLSGISSTIGGGLSQNNAFFGSGTQGPSSDSVTSLTVVLADGSIVKTGTAASPQGKPFWRQYGPDLTGLFLSDAGALAYKAEASLRLITAPTAEDWASFEFDTRDEWVSAMAKMGRMGLACELFGFDPNLTKVRMKRDSLANDIKALKNVIKGQGGLMKGLKEGAKVALAGRGYMDKVAYSLHATAEGHSEAEVKAKTKTLKEIAARHNGKEIENSIPKIIRANPFTPLNNILGPQGERWAPIHGIVPMGDAVKCAADIDEMFASMASEFKAEGVYTGYLFTTLSTNGFLIEPVFYWPEEIYSIHENTIDPNVMKQVKRYDKNNASTAVVEKGRQNILDIFSKYGAAHFQIGRTYPYTKNMSPETKSVLNMIKAGLDPDGLVNSGALGLD